MSQISLTRILTPLLSLTLMQVSWLPLAAADGAAGGSCQPVKTCSTMSAKADSKAASDLNLDDVSAAEGLAELNNLSSEAKQLACDAEKECKKQKNICKPNQNNCTAQNCSDLDGTIKKMAKFCAGVGDTNTAGGEIQEATAAQDAEPAPASSGGGGGMGGMGAALLGAAAGGLLGYMLGKKQGEKDEENDGALQEDGTLDCSQDDAHKYQGCNGVLESVCMTALDDPRCQRFANRYCGSAASGGNAPAILPLQQTAPTTLPVTTTASAVKGVPGEGTGSPYCKLVVASNFCKTSGRNMCPSCIQLARRTAAECVNDPALCVSQNSPEQARQVCPTDPIFSDPTYIATGGGAGSPTVVLPGDPTIGAPSTTGAPTTLPVGAGAGTGTPTTGAPGVILSSVGRQPAHSGPASDVQGKYGPNVFTVGSSAIRNRCAAGKFLNCP